MKHTLIYNVFTGLLGIDSFYKGGPVVHSCKPATYAEVLSHIRGFLAFGDDVTVTVINQ